MHDPVLYQEIIQALRPRDGGFYVDGTVGAGGHSWGILEASSPSGKLLGFDLDPQALDLARERLSLFGDRATLVQESYSTLGVQLESLGWDSVHGILLDLGLSSMQLDTPERGFSHRFDGPLDMRFDPEAEIKAADLVNNLPEKDLANIIYRYGEERHSRRVAREIVAARPIHTTKELKDIIQKNVRKGRSRVHPATRTFQALRIATNQELDTVESVLPQAVTALATGGRLVVVSFHSLEDRIVKHFFKQESRDCICPPEKPICDCDHQPTLRVVTRKPIRPEEVEVEANPRARSARLRVAEKL
ncbi:MAG: 16S rRNA (cytosine(1402)-N(4))-methyltransferase RsmH [Anaerolineales bacterium]|nr:16S rRNA (cytosine(1402)-N(4))-methyltransferase RsmH [Chloroflexota bacterium]MBL6980568.1 16S rRNA (cytosine(1402)-N(4))-methyltransferase RsmH [Anaerolineales bacterium]